MDESDNGAQGPSEAVEALLERHGIEQHRKQVPTLAAILGLTEPVARRRLTGAAPFTVDELERLAVHFSEPVFELVATLLSSVGVSRRATIRVGSAQARCVIWTGRSLSPNERNEPLVAISSEEGAWAVVPVAEAIDRPAYEITRLVYETALLPKICLLDDDLDAAEPIAQFFRAKGLSASTYGRADHVRVALESTSFAGFVLDWRLAEGDVVELLRVIRQQCPTAPIVILTGRMRDGAVTEAEIAQAAAKHQCQLYEKPVRPLVLYNALTLALRSGQHSGASGPDPR